MIATIWLGHVNGIVKPPFRSGNKTRGKCHKSLQYRVVLWVAMSADSAALYRKAFSWNMHLQLLPQSRRLLVPAAVIIKASPCSW